VLLGLLLDRDAISLRLVALAACVVLAVDPAALFGASFQMSFAAVTALVAFYERWRWRRAGRDAWWSQHLGLYVLGVLVTTLVASLATAPFAALHFGRLPTYGVLANLVAVPLMAFWIMPLGLLSLLLMPFGLDAPVLRLMGLGIDGVLWSATTATSWPGASLSLPQPSGLAVLLLCLGGLWVGVWRGRLARLALAPVAAAILLFVTTRPPDVVVDRAASMALLRDGPGAYVLLAAKRDGFVLRGWTRALGIAGPLPSEQARAVVCDEGGCRVERAGRSVRVVAAGVPATCDADIVIAPTDDACPGALTVGPGELDRRGALTVRLGRSQPLRFVHADTHRRRPWQRLP
jgi:competence protein ComEC